MDPKTLQPSLSIVHALAASQHGVVTRAQLLALGLSTDAIKHRLRRGRLHPVRRGVYAVGRAEVTAHGALMAAVLACGSGAVLSHTAAGALWAITSHAPRAVEVSVPAASSRRCLGVVVHRRRLAATDITRCHAIPVTIPVQTLIDLAGRMGRDEVEAAVNEADKRGLVDPERLREALGGRAGQTGVAALRAILDRRTFTLTDTVLERRFLPLARRAGLPRPETQRWVNGFRVDFYWPELGLVVETDGLRYHRTPMQQAKDRVRDQMHTAAGLTPLRFTRAQVAFEPAHVQRTLAAVGGRLHGRT